jgi:hypothetical protein
MNTSRFSIRALAVALAAGLLAVVAGATATGAVAQGAPNFKIVKFDDAMKDQLVRSLPLKLAFPADYEMLVLDPAINGTVWARRGDLDHIARTKDVPPGAGLFHGRLTTRVGYDRASNSFICGPGCGEADMKAELAAAGANVIKIDKHVINGVPMLLLEIDTANMAGAVRKTLYMAYIAVLIDTNVFLISFSPPRDGTDDGRAAWQAFSRALTRTDTIVQQAVVRHASPVDDFARAARSATFRPVADAFIAALAAGDTAKSMGLISPNLLNRAGRDNVQGKLHEQTLPFFATFKELGRSVTIAPTADEFGNDGFVFYLTMTPREGEARPFAVYVVEENGRNVIANIQLDHDSFKAGLR